MTDALERRIDELTSRQDILDAVLRCARGFDRCDSALIASAFHSDATISYGSAFTGGVEAMVEWADETHRPLEATYHQIANHYVVFEEGNPDVAHGETYVIGSWRTAEQDITEQARYVYRFERRGAEWRIVQRCSVLDIVKAEMRAGAFANELNDGRIAPSRSRHDPS